MQEVQTAPKNHGPINFFNLLLIILAVAVLAAGLYFISHHKDTPVSNYPNLQTYNLKSDQDSTGMSIDKPEAINLFGGTGAPAKVKLTKKPTAARFTQQKKVKGKMITVAGISLNSSPNNPTASANNPLLAQLLNSPKSPAYTASVLPLQFYINGIINPNVINTLYKITFDKTQTFTNPNIKTNAWIMSFDATAKNPKTTSLAEYKGQVLEAIGKNATYYMAVYAQSDNWQANQSTWQQIFNSLKIDQ